MTAARALAEGDVMLDALSKRRRPIPTDALELAKLVGFAPDPWQRRLLATKGNVLLNCSRQAGKSTGASLLVVHRAITQPKHLALLISPSLRQSSELFRKVRDFIGRVPGLKLAADNATSVVFDNGSRIVSLPSSENTIRGFSSVNTLIEDEAAFVEDSLNVAVRPMLAVSGGQMILMSTPNGKRGHFYNAWSGEGAWHRERVPCWEVPRIPHDFLAEEKRVLGELFRQEYECEFINALSGRVYQSDDVLNCIETMPGGSAWTYLCGLDFGIVDENAVTVLGWRAHDQCVYVAESYRLKASPHEMAEEVHKLSKRYNFARIVGDEGGMGKAFAEEMRGRFRIPVEPAEKQNKVGYISLFNGDLRRGRIKVVKSRSAQLLDEWRNLPWAEGKNKEAEGFANHCADATLYAWRAAHAFLEQDAPKPDTRTLEEREDDEERRLARELDRDDKNDRSWARRMLGRR